jgi:hypothetical protein
MKRDVVGQTTIEKHICLGNYAGYSALTHSRTLSNVHRPYDVFIIYARAKHID